MVSLKIFYPVLVVENTAKGRHSINQVKHKLKNKPINGKGHFFPDPEYLTSPAPQAWAGQVRANNKLNYPVLRAGNIKRQINKN